MRVSNDSINAAPESSNALIPAGLYTVLVESHEDRMTNAGVPYASLTLQVLEGEHKGRKLWDSLFPTHEKEGFRNWSLRRIRHMREAAGMPEGDVETSSLVGKIFTAKVGINKSKDPQWPDKNQVEDYESRDAGASPPASQSRPAPASIDVNPLDEETPF
jgi:hypothetical protein